MVTREVIAKDVIHEAIAIVVNAIAGDLTRISPHLIAKILMIIVHPSVNDSHDHSTRQPFMNGPGFRCVNVNITVLMHAHNCE